MEENRSSTERSGLVEDPQRYPPRPEPECMAEKDENIRKQTLVEKDIGVRRLTH